MNEMMLYLDTEFTDFKNPKLLSVGLVSDDDQKFYVQLSNGWKESDCSEFVLHNVLPLFTTDSLPRSDASYKLIHWLRSFDEPVRIICDSQYDSMLLQDLICVVSTILDNNIRSIEVHGFEEAVDDPCDFVEHHALNDAIALKNLVNGRELEPTKNLLRRPFG